MKTSILIFTILAATYAGDASQATRTKRGILSLGGFGAGIGYGGLGGEYGLSGGFRRGYGGGYGDGYGVGYGGGYGTGYSGEYGGGYGGPVIRLGHGRLW